MKLFVLNFQFKFSSLIDIWENAYCYSFLRPAHSAPLSIEFYKGTNCGVNGAFPCEAINDAFVAFRG